MNLQTRLLDGSSGVDHDVISSVSSVLPPAGKLDQQSSTLHLFPHGTEPKMAKTPSEVATDAILSVGMVQVAMILAFGIFVRYDTKFGSFDGPTGPSSAVISYQYFKDVSIMIFIGFGFLMTYLRKYGYGAIAFTFLVSCVVMEWSILTNGFFNCLAAHEWASIPLNLPTLIEALFAIASILITFGGIIGKVSPSQLLLLAFLETAFYSFNSYLVTFQIKSIDVGGSIVIHMFGAYFGLASSFVLSRKIHGSGSFDDCANSYISDMFSFIGTIFLWIYWPSFNSGVAPDSSRLFTTVNTLLSLCSSCIFAFFISRQLRHKSRFDVVDIQNATLAGGVAIGACSDLSIGPAWSMAIGGAAGCLSVIGYVKIQPFLENKLGLHDTCGINNLHGMPSILGGIASIIAVGVVTGDEWTNPTDGTQGYPTSHQSLAQLYGILTTLSLGLISGYLSSHLVLFLYPHKGIFFTDEV